MTNRLEPGPGSRFPARSDGYAVDMEMSHRSQRRGSLPIRRRLRRVSAALTLATLVLASGCGSDDPDVGPPADSGTVVPPDPNGVGGGVPVDNLDPDVADTTYQVADDTDGDGAPD